MLCLGMELIFICDLYGRPTGEGQRVLIQGFAVNSRELRWCPTLVTGQTRRRGMCCQVVSWSFWYTTWRMLSFCWCTTGKDWTVMQSMFFFLQGFCNQMGILVTVELEKHEICLYLCIIVARENIIIYWYDNGEERFFLRFVCDHKVKQHGLYNIVFLGADYHKYPNCWILNVFGGHLLIWRWIWQWANLTNNVNL